MPKVSRIMLTTLSEYLDLILKLDFPQTNLLKANKFLEYLKKDDLEYYDKSEVIRPVLRLYKPPFKGRATKIFYGCLDCLMGNPLAKIADNILIYNLLKGSIRWIYLLKT